LTSLPSEVYHNIRILQNAAKENQGDCAGGALHSPVSRLKWIEHAHLTQFNLGCYACLSGNLFSARKNLIQMFQLAEKTDEVNFFRNLVIGDSDLEKLLPEVSRIIEISSRLNHIKEKENYAQSQPFRNPANGT